MVLLVQLFAPGECSVSKPLLPTGTSVCSDQLKASLLQSAKKKGCNLKVFAV